MKKAFSLLLIASLLAEPLPIFAATSVARAPSCSSRLFTRQAFIGRLAQGFTFGGHITEALWRKEGRLYSLDDVKLDHFASDSFGHSGTRPNETTWRFWENPSGD